MRVLVVEDSLTIRKHMVALFERSEGFDVVGEAADGKTAIELCAQLRPDVITMDMMLPVMTGLAATEYIMAHTPTPIVIVSASTNRGELFRTYDALAAGAIDVVEKPQGVELNGAWEQELLATTRMASRIRVITHLRGRRSTPSSAAPAIMPGGSAPRVVAIGASTGGPSAARTILKALPGSFPLTILLVVHIAESFGTAMADWLAAETELEVRYARDGEPLPTPGRCRVLMAPPGRHLIVERGKLRLSDRPERHSCRPSVDELFESLAREIGPETVACLLTGMGRDGAQGLLTLRQHGALTIAQDQETSVVFGMPGEAARIGAAASVLPLPAIAAALVRLAAGPSATAGDAR